MGTKHLLTAPVRAAASAALHPVRTASMAAGLAKGTVEVGVGLVRGALGHQPPRQRVEVPETPAQPPAPAQRSDEPVDPRDVLPGPDVVAPGLPRAEDLPEPIVIEADDAAEGEAFHTEPKAAGRDSEHGGGPADREEVEGYLEEVVDTTEPEVDVVTPVGTTGADVATNPDTAESDLQQPGTPPLMDPALAKSVRSEAETLQRAADPEK